MTRKLAQVLKEECVACGCCAKVCPRSAISIPKGVYAVIDTALCVGCGMCAKACPADEIDLIPREVEA